MAITPNDFDKIWSTNASTPAYTFSDADYLEGWDFVGNLPPTRAQWNAIQKRTDEKMKYVFDNFGAPLIAPTVADMTLQNRVYVYTGSEVGYTAGDWYYYDAGTSTWVDGGVYNAVAIVTDTTLTQAGVPADAKATGDAIALKPNVDPTLTISGAAADAKVVGDNLKSVYAEYATATLAVYDSVSSRALSNAGATSYDANSKVMTYAVTAGEKVKLNLATRESEPYKVTWEFTTVGTISSLGSGSVVAGTIHTGAIDDVVIVPTGATYLAIAQRIDNTTNTVQKKVLTDKTLSISGEAADAKVVRDNLDSIEDNFDSIYNQYEHESAVVSATNSSRAISNAGGVAYDGNSKNIYYSVTPKDILLLNLASRDTESYKATWVFWDSHDALVGDVHFGAINDTVIVPTGADKLVVAQRNDNTTNRVYKIKLPNNDQEIKLLAKGSYESLKGGFEYGALDGDTGQPGTFSLKWVHSATLVSYDRDVVVYTAPGYRWALHLFRSDGTWIGIAGGYNDYNIPQQIPSGTYFKLNITTTDVRDIDMDDLPTSILVTAPLFNTYHISNPNIKQVAHAGYKQIGYSTGGNLAKNYKAAAIMGFTHGETDVAFTSDGVAVCIHDSSFVDETSGDTVVIATTTYADLITHNYRQGQPPSTFDEIVKTCKENGMGLFIDHLDVSFTNTQWQTLFDIVHKYAMQDKVFWTTTGEQIPNKVKTYFPDANFVVVITTQSGFASGLAVANAIKTDKNEVELSLSYTAFPANSLPSYISQMPPTITIDVWPVDDITTWKSYVPYVSGIVSNAMCSNLARIVG